jgi:predicted RNA binding protein YcfA (HicA-like mRNA interferase family)
MTRITPLSAREVCRRLSKLSFTKIRQKGSHSFWRHKDGKCVVVPIHRGEDISRGLIKSILNSIEISWEKFQSL